MIFVCNCDLYDFVMVFLSSLLLWSFASLSVFHDKG